MLELEYAGLSEQGPVRDNNEDFIAQYCPAEPDDGLRKGALFVVADGVGGSRAGEVASKEASQRLITCYYQSARKPQRALQEAFTQSNLHICDLGYAHPEYRRMQTTLTTLTLVDNRVHIGHVGDSRIYRVRRGQIEQLTNDHSEVGELVRMALITAEEARHHPRRNIITRTVGGDLLLRPDFRSEPVEAGDIFVLCTDGLWEPVDEAEIVAATTQYSPADACRYLVDLALERGSEDNISVQAVKVLALGPQIAEPAGRTNGLLKRAFRFLGNQEPGR